MTPLLYVEEDFCISSNPYRICRFEPSVSFQKKDEDYYVVWYQTYESHYLW